MPGIKINRFQSKQQGYFKVLITPGDERGGGG